MKPINEIKVLKISELKFKSKYYMLWHLRKRLTRGLANVNIGFFTKMQKFVHREEKKRHEKYGAIMHHDLCAFVEELNTINPIDGTFR